MTAPAKTSRLTWLIAGFIGLAVVSSIGVHMMDPPQCPEVDPAAFFTRDGQPEDISYLLAKARRLSAAGECAIEGGWGAARQQYYIAVYRAGSPERPYHLRFEREELMQ